MTFYFGSRSTDQPAIEIGQRWVHRENPNLILTIVDRLINVSDQWHARTAGGQSKPIMSVELYEDYDLLPFGVASIEQGIADAKAGRVTPVDDTMLKALEGDD